MRWTSERWRCGVDGVRVDAAARDDRWSLRRRTTASNAMAEQRASVSPQLSAAEGSAMVLLHVKRSDKDTWLFDTPAATVAATAAEMAAEVTAGEAEDGGLGAQVDGGWRRTAR